MEDFVQYINENEKHFEDLRSHLEENEANKGEKFRMSVFNSMVVFLMKNEKRVDNYLKDSEISEMVYNFHKGTEYHERYSVDDILMNPLDTYLSETA